MQSIGFKGCDAYGRSWIDVAAPTGSTSDAAAVGGGLAALMVAANPSLTPEQLKAAFLNGVDVLSSTQGKVASNVRAHFHPFWKGTNYLYERLDPLDMTEVWCSAVANVASGSC